MSRKFTRQITTSVNFIKCIDSNLNIQFILHPKNNDLGSFFKIKQIISFEYEVHMDCFKGKVKIYT